MSDKSVAGVDRPHVTGKLIIIGGLTLALGVGLLLVLALVQDREHYHRQAGLADLIDGYRMIERSVKYGIGLIGSTFGVLLFLEAMGKARVHTMHYVSIGIAMVMFYMLLLSIFELAGFTVAYIIAAGMVIGLNTFYLTGNVAANMQHSPPIVGSSLTALYLVSYFLLSQGDFALLTGTLIGFAMLAAFMTATRRFDWDQFGKDN